MDLFRQPIIKVYTRNNPVMMEELRKLNKLINTKNSNDDFVMVAMKSMCMCKTDRVERVYYNI